jgi:hypothetical protein
LDNTEKEAHRACQLRGIFLCRSFRVQLNACKAIQSIAGKAKEKSK